MTEERDQRRVGGRPPLLPEEARTERVVTFLTPGERKRLGEFADASAVSISAASHQLIIRSLERRSDEAQERD